jgi:collagenase-like PrtC family protease
MEMNTYRIALGPLLYYWPRQQTFDFYSEVARGAADIVYLGETVCSRRHELRLADWLTLAETLRDAGKVVYLSTPTLIESNADAHALRRLAEQTEFGLEVGEMGAIRHLAGRHFVAGPHLNAYSGPTLAWLARQGAGRFVVPIEMGEQSLARLLAERPPGLECEYMVWGRMPLAFSARCFTARHYHLNKDACEFRCLDHPDGMLMRTQEQSDFLCINGIQTQSAHCLDLLAQSARIAAMGVDVLRVSPQSKGTHEALASLAQQRQGLAVAPVCPPAGIARCNGYWYGGAGIDWREEG